MRTKEDILKEEYSKLIVNPDKVYAQNPSIIEAAHTSMDVFAKQQAIDFAKWTAENLWTVYGDQWYPYRDEDNPISADQLYAQFIKSQSK